VDVSYHVKGDDIAERDLASLVALNQMLVDQDRTAPRRQAQNKRPLGSRIEGLDALYAGALADYAKHSRQKEADQ